MFRHALDCLEKNLHRINQDIQNKLTALNIDRQCLASRVKMEPAHPLTVTERNMAIVGGSREKSEILAFWTIYQFFIFALHWQWLLLRKSCIQSSKAINLTQKHFRFKLIKTVWNIHIKIVFESSYFQQRSLYINEDFLLSFMARFVLIIVFDEPLKH